MLKNSFIFFVLGFCGVAGCQSSPTPFRIMSAEPSLKFSDICKSDGNLKIKVEGIPKGTKSWAVVGVGQSGSEARAFWVSYNIPRSEKEISSIRDEESLWQFGRNDLGKVEYTNPCQHLKNLKSIEVRAYAFSIKMPPFFVPPTQKDLFTAGEKSLLSQTKISYQ